jgi:O-antigen/teichoic acid export membrane protein
MNILKQNLKVEMMNAQKFSVKLFAIKSVKWTALGEIASRSIQPIVTLILARLLTPADFGVVGVAMIAIGLAQIFQDFGLGKTLIQRETEIEKSANIVFWTNLPLSIVIYLIIFLTAPLISVFFHEPKVIDVVRVLCFQIILFSFVTVHQALFQRRFQFKQLFFIRLSSSAVPGFISIPLALYGYGVWALVFGTLTGAVVQVLLFWKFSKWRPQLNYDFPLAKQLFGFSAWVTIESFLGWLLMCGDLIVLGHFLGVRELGIYRIGINILTIAFGIIINPIVPIVYPAFSRLKIDSTKFIQTFLKMTNVIATFALPIGVGIFILAKPISSVIFGQKWQGLDIVLAIIGLREAIAWLVGLNLEAYRALGRPDINSKLLIIHVFFYIPVYTISASYGLSIFCLARLALAIIGIGLHLFVVHKLFKLPVTYIIDCIKAPLMGVLVMGTVVYCLFYIMNIANRMPEWLNLSGTLAVGAISYILFMNIIEEDFIKKFFRLAKEAVTK